MSVTISGNGQTVLQVVQTSFATQTSTTSTTPVATPVTATITPNATTSKVLVEVFSPVYINSTQPLYVQIYRDSTPLGTAVTALQNINAVVSGTAAINFLDSPSTTSSTTYTLYFYVSGATGYIAFADGQATMTLTEISGS